MTAGRARLRPPSLPCCRPTGVTRDRPTPHWTPAAPAARAAPGAAVRSAVGVDAGDQLAQDALGVLVGDLAGAGRAVAAAAVGQHQLADVGPRAAVQDRLARGE